MLNCFAMEKMSNTDLTPHTSIPWIEYSSKSFSNLVEPHVWFTASRQNIFHFENKLHFSQPESKVGLTTSQTSLSCPA